MAAGRARLFGRELHLLPHGRTVPNAISVKLHSYSLGGEIAQKNLNLEDVLTSGSLHFDFSAMEHAPLLFQPMPGFDHLPAKQALLDDA